MPDVEKLLVAWLAARTGHRVATDLPGNLAEAVPLVQVTRVGGARKNPRQDRPAVDIDVYAIDRAAARDLCAEVLADLVLALPGATLPGAVVHFVEEISGPVARPYDNTTLRRFGASVSITLRAA